MSVDRSLETKKGAIDSTSGSTEQNLSEVKCNPSLKIVDGSITMRIQDHLDYPWSLPREDLRVQTPICGDSISMYDGSQSNLLDIIS